VPPFGGVKKWLESFLSRRHAERARYCVVCGECLECNLRPCRENGAHQ